MQRKRNSLIIYIGLFLIFSGALILIYKYSSIKKLEKHENQQIEEFFQEEKEVIENNEVEENVTKVEKDEEYSMVIKIPKINLYKGLYDIKSKKNNVNNNIEILKESDMPNVSNGNLLLASHNGTSSISFFRNLYQIKNNDLVYIYYKNVEYIYEIVDIYDQNKTGTVTIHRNPNETIIALITCKKGTTNMQVVYIGNLISKSDY